jgi:tRNA (cmo5U34)-methyltransferase
MNWPAAKGYMQLRNRSRLLSGVAPRAVDPSVASIWRKTVAHDKHTPFAHAASVASYAEQTYLKVPGLADLHRMVMLLLAENVPEAAEILVVGAGGGLETKAMALSQHAWRFTGVDPSEAMMDLARQALQPFAHRVNLVPGTIDAAPVGPFDGATCILTLHHIDPTERLHTLREIRRRLKPGARIVLAHHSAPGLDPAHWMKLSVAFGDRSGLNWERSAATARMMSDRLPLLTPTEEESQLREAGFQDVELFYAAFSFRGWTAKVGPK